MLVIAPPQIALGLIATMALSRGHITTPEWAELVNLERLVNAAQRKARRMYVPSDQPKGDPCST